MSMKKAFDQTIRDLKREVNKKVLKVPSIEQKVLDATSNESWGPHGSLLADIAQATRNFHEYQMIMSVLWKRLNDTGKNWRHVYKALTVLEYLVANGSERVIEEIKEHAYQISTLSDFQYIDSSGRDQGNNVRRKSQSLVLLVNDMERIEEVRQKAATNRDKFRSPSAVDGMYRPGSGGYGDDRSEGHYDERNGYGREREWGYRDDERHGRYGDSYNRDGDRYGKNSEDDDSRGRARSVDEYQYGSRSRSSDRDGDRAYDENDRHSARGSSARGEDHSDGRQIERKFSEQNIDAPPSYEDAVGASRSPTYSDRDGEAPPASAPQSSSPIMNTASHSSSPIPNATSPSASPHNNVNPSQSTAGQGFPPNLNVEADAFDEFDPRGSVSAAPSISNTAEMDLFGSLSDVFSPSPLATLPALSATSDIQTDSTNYASDSSLSVPLQNNVPNQGFEDPFGDSPFKAIQSDQPPTQTHHVAFSSSFHPTVNHAEHTQPAAQNSETSNMEFAEGFSGLSFNPATAPDMQTPLNQQFLPQSLQPMQDNDILAGILPPGPHPTMASHGTFSASPGMPAASQAAFPPSNVHSQPALDFMIQAEPTTSSYAQFPSQHMAMPSSQNNSFSYSAPSNALNSNVAPQTSTGSFNHQNNSFTGDMFSQSGATIPASSQSASLSSADALTLVPQQPAQEMFEPKSAVWADTLSRGLVNLNISGSKINPLSDIGIDFESLNRKEKRMEKPSATPVTSNVTMGKAMGSGSGIGRAGMAGIRPSSNPMMGSGMGAGPGSNMGMGGYGSNQHPSMGGMGVGMGMGAGMNMGINMVMGQQGVNIQPSNGIPPGSNMNNYNPMMGRSGYPQGPQQPYGGAYR